MFTKKLFSRAFSILVIASFVLSQVGPAQAAPLGSISGTLLDGSLNPITGVAVQVRALRVSDGFEEAVTFSNPADGTYLLSDLPTGVDLNIIASDEDPDTDGFAGVYYDRSDAPEWANIINLDSAAPDTTGIDVILGIDSYTVVEHLTFNTRAGRLLNDVEIRRAIAYGTNRQTLLEDAFEPYGISGQILNAMLSPHSWFMADPADLTVYDYNPAQAGLILDSAGWADTDTDGIRENASDEELALDFFTTQAAMRVASAALFKAQMADIGIRVNVYTLPASEFFSTDPAVSPLASGDFDIAEFAWALADNYAQFITVYNSSDPQNYGGFSSATLDMHEANARQEKQNGNLPGFEDNALLWQQTFADELPALPLFSRGAFAPPPSFGVRANWDSLEGWGWRNGAIATIEIDRDGDGTPEATGSAPIGPTPWNPSEIRFEYNFFGEYDIQPGDTVTVSDGFSTKSTIVTPLAFTDFDVDDDLVYGIADPGVEVAVWACDEIACYHRFASSDPVTGEWMVDFAHPGARPEEQDLFDLVLGSWVDSSQSDADGDSTMFGKNVPNPRVEASVIHNWVHARDWPRGTLMTLEIDQQANGLGAVDYTTTAIMDQAPWNPGDPNDVVAPFDLNNLWLEPGDVLTVYGEMNGSPLTKVLTVSQLWVTAYDLDNDIIHGIATPGRVVQICINTNGPCLERFPLADPLSGEWQADYSGEHDLQTGDNGWLVEVDNDGDQTNHDWQVPYPRFEVRPNEDRIEVRDFQVGETATLEIDHDGDGTPDLTRTAPVSAAPWNPYESWFEFRLFGEYDIQAGDVITITDGINTKTLQVSPLAFTDIDLNNDLVYGLADPNINVAIWACGPGYCYNRYLTPDPVSGEWMADFANPGTNPGEDGTIDLKGGTWVDSSQEDDDRDSTMYGINIPSPYIGANLVNQWIHAREWPRGTEVSLEIDSLSNGLGGVDFSATATMQQAPWNPGDPNDIVGEFDLAGFQFGVGDVLTVSGELFGNTVTKHLTVANLRLTSYDLVADILEGLASPGKDIEVCVNEPGTCAWQMVTSDPLDGSWLADYAGQHDLKAGDNGWASERDEDGDNMWLDWNIPNPQITASAQNDWVEAREWPKDTVLTLEIDDLSNGLGGVDYTTTGIMQQAPWNPGDPNDIVGLFDLHGFDITAGDVVRVSGDLQGSTVTKELVVSELHITAVDPDADSIAGFATPGRDVEVCINTPYNCAWKLVPSDPTDGAWLADYSTEFDIRLGNNGWAAEVDDDFDRTWYDWNLPYPHIDAWFQHDRVNAYDWPLGETVTITIEDPSTPASPDYTNTALVGPAPWDHHQAAAVFELEGLFDFGPGMTIKVSGAGVTKELAVVALSVTQVNTATDVVGGQTAPEQGLWMWFEDSCCRNTQADPSGQWAIDFSLPGPNGEPTADLRQERHHQRLGR